MITLNHLIHDICGVSCSIGAKIQVLLREGKISKEDSEKIRKRLKDMDDVLDGFYAYHKDTLTKEFYIKLNQNNLEKQLHD